MKNDIPVTGVTIAPEIESITAAEAKAIPPGRRWRFRRRVTYSLANGETYGGYATGQSKPKLEKAVADTIRHAAAGCYSFVPGLGIMLTLTARLYTPPAPQPEPAAA